MTNRIGNKRSLLSTSEMDPHIQVMMSKVLHRHRNPPAGSLGSLSWAHEVTLKFAVSLTAQNCKQEVTGDEAHNFKGDKKSVLSPQHSIPFDDACKAPAGTTFF